MAADPNSNTDDNVNPFEGAEINDHLVLDDLQRLFAADWIQTQEEHQDTQINNYPLSVDEIYDDDRPMFSVPDLLFDVDYNWIPEQEDEDPIFQGDSIINEEELNLIDPDIHRYFSSTDYLSEDPITKNLKVRSVVDVKRAADDENEAEACAVCLESLFEREDKIAVLDCGHEYHVGCISNWLMRKNCCPLCNARGVGVNYCGRN